MDSNILISIVITDHGENKDLEKCLKLLLNQSLKETEIIYKYDSGLLTKDAEAIRDLEKLDSRIHISENNRTDLSNAAAGAAQSCGKYILFTGWNAELETEACTKLYREMEREACDLLHFPLEIENYDLRKEKKELTAEYPQERKIQGRLANACFVEKRFDESLENKLFQGELMRKAASVPAGEGMEWAQEAFLLFRFLLDARVYRGLLPENGFYGKMDGRKRSRSFLKIEQIRRNGAQLRISGRIDEIIKERHEADQHAQAATAFTQALIEDALNRLNCDVPKKNRRSGFEEICRNIEPEELLKYMA